MVGGYGDITNEVAVPLPRQIPNNNNIGYIL